LRVIKRQVYDAMFQPLAESFEISEREMLASLPREDFKEGMAHSVERRPTVFTGKEQGLVSFELGANERPHSSDAPV
jgi:hypothetical protein